MIFETRVHGIPCQCHVTNYSPAVPMRVYGTGFGDANPPEGEEFDFEILDRKGRRAMWLDKYLNEETSNMLLEEYIIMKEAEYYDNY